LLIETIHIFDYISFLNLEVIQLKLLKDLAHAYRDIYFADADKRRRKNKCKKTFTCFLLTYAQRLTAAPVIVTQMIRVEEKKENQMVDIK
jgi:hypothetical protein